MARARTPRTPFYRFNSSPEIIRLVVMMYVKFPLSLRNVEDLLHERGIDICHETVRFWWNRFRPMFAAEIRRRRVEAMRQHTHWRWHLDEVYVRINGDALPLASGRPGGRGAGILRHQEPRQGGRPEVHQESDEASWLSQGHHDRPTVCAPTVWP